MDRLNIHEQGSRQAEALREALAVLHRAGVHKDECWIGGGAALAARWRHRRAESIDLFIPARGYTVSAGWPEYPSSKDRIAQCLPAAQAASVVGEAEWAQWDTGHGRAGVFATFVDEGHEPLHDAVAATHDVRVECAAATLARKARLRWSATGQLFDRDLADLTAAACHAPDSVEQWWNLAPPRMANVVADEIEYLDTVHADRSPPLRWLRAHAARLLRNRGRTTASAKDTTQRLTTLCLTPRGYARQVHHPEVLAEEAFACARLTARPRHPRDQAKQEWCADMFAKSMAGARWRPTFETLRQWLDGPAPTECEPRRQVWLGAAMTEMDGCEAMLFRQSWNLSLHDIARIAHAGRGHGLTFTAWLNQYAHRAHARTDEDAEAYGLAGVDAYGG